VRDIRKRFTPCNIHCSIASCLKFGRGRVMCDGLRTGGGARGDGTGPTGPRVARVYFRILVLVLCLYVGIS
jgi:hypothetical protein